MYTSDLNKRMCLYSSILIPDFDVIISLAKLCYWYQYIHLDFVLFANASYGSGIRFVKDNDISLMQYVPYVIQECQKLRRKFFLFKK